MLDFPAALAIVILFGVILLPGTTVLAIVTALRHERIRRGLERAAAKGFSGRPGPAVLHGRVVAGGEERPPVSIAIEQVGTEIEVTGGFRTDWSEERRTLRAEPFEVETAEALRVRVEPDESTRLAVELDDVEVIGVARRECRATIAGGDEVWVVGAMRPRSSGTKADSAYRGGVAAVEDAPRALAMRGMPGEPLLLSKRKVGADRKLRSVYHAVAALVFLGFTLAYHVAYLGDFHRSVWFGKTVTGVALGSRTSGEWVRTRGGGYGIDRHFVTFAYKAGGKATTVEVEVPKEAFETYKRKSVLTRTLRVTPGPNIVAALGRYPRVSTAAVTPAAIALLLAAFYLLGARSLRPWYERKRLDERTDGRTPIVIPKREALATAASRHGRAEAPPRSEAPSGEHPLPEQGEAEADREAQAEIEARTARLQASRPPG